MRPVGSDDRLAAGMVEDGADWVEVTELERGLTLSSLEDFNEPSLSLLDIDGVYD